MNTNMTDSDPPSNESAKAHGDGPLARLLTVAQMHKSPPSSSPSAAAGGGDSSIGVPPATAVVAAAVTSEKRLPATGPNLKKAPAAAAAPATSPAAVARIPNHASSSCSSSERNYKKNKCKQKKKKQKSSRTKASTSSTKKGATNTQTTNVFSPTKTQTPSHAQTQTQLQQQLAALGMAHMDFPGQHLAPAASQSGKNPPHPSNNTMESLGNFGLGAEAALDLLQQLGLQHLQTLAGQLELSVPAQQEPPKGGQQQQQPAVNSNNNLAAASLLAGIIAPTPAPGTAAAPQKPPPPLPPAMAASPFKFTTQSVPIPSDKSSPGTIILPCRARGMPVEHNFRTAHFVIPGDISHGEDLICSYEACKSTGVKFRFCSTCRVPVAKRNFFQRHSHGRKPSGQKSSSSSSKNAKRVRAAQLSVEGRPQYPAAATNIPSETPSGVAIQSLSSSTQSTAAHAVAPLRDSSEATSNQSGVGSYIRPHKRAKPMQSVSCEQLAKKARASRELNNEDISLTRQLRWATLLGKRPDAKDGDAMSEWLLDIMAVSDLKTPMKSAGTSSLTASSSNSLQDDSASTLESDDSLDRKEDQQQNARAAKKKYKKRKSGIEVQADQTQKKSKKSKCHSKEDGKGFDQQELHRSKKQRVLGREDKSKLKRKRRKSEKKKNKDKKKVSLLGGEEDKAMSAAESDASVHTIIASTEGTQIEAKEVDDGVLATAV